MAAKNQIGFFTVICLPMLEAFADGFEAAKPLLQQAQANVQWWRLRTPDNYTIQDIGTYRTAMNVTVEQQPEASLIDFVTDLDRESGMKLPECGEEQEVENHAFGTGKKNWAKARRLSTRKVPSRENLVSKIGRAMSRENLMSSRESIFAPVSREVHPIYELNDAMQVGL